MKQIPDSNSSMTIQIMSFTCGVLGVELLPNGTKIKGDLVIDASGPGSAAPQWLEEGGYAAPHTVKVDPLVGYTFSIVDVPQEASLGRT